MNDIKKIKYWCHKILPLAYDDSLSYYEVLCKVNAKLNEVIDIVNNISDESAEIEELKNKIQGLSSQINTNIVAINALRDRDNVIANDLNNLENDYNKTKLLVDELNSVINNLTNKLENEIKVLDIKLNNKIDIIQREIYSELYVIESEIDKIIDEINKKYGIDVYNYSANKRLTLDANNVKLYVDLENAISAEEYCSLGLSADDYKKYDISAMAYLRDSKKLLHYYWVYMCVNGTKQEINNALTEVYNGFAGTMTEDEYVKTGLTAEEYEALNLTNTEYRSYNPQKKRGYVNLNGVGLTREQYSRLGIE